MRTRWRAGWRSGGFVWGELGIDCRQSGGWFSGYWDCLHADDGWFDSSFHKRIHFLRNTHNNNAAGIMGEKTRFWEFFIMLAYHNLDDILEGFWGTFLVHFYGLWFG